MKYTSQRCCDKIDDRMASNREQWGNSNMTKNLFAISFGMLFPELYKIMVNEVTFVGSKPL